MLQGIRASMRHVLLIEPQKEQPRRADSGTEREEARSDRSDTANARKDDSTRNDKAPPPQGGEREP